MTEAQLKRAVLDIAYANGWLVYHRQMRKVKGSQGRGFPDLNLARSGIALWFELKQEGEPIEPEQAAWKAALPVGRCFTIYPSDLPRVERMLRA